jgi:hypothetical protein
MYLENSSMLSQPDTRKQRSKLLLVLLCLCGLCGLSGCGYGFSSGTATVLDIDARAMASAPVSNGQDTAAPNYKPDFREHTLKIKSIDHHTLYPWLAQVIRSTLRDEIGARKIAVWLDAGNADYSIQLIIHSFTMRTSVHDENDTSMLFSADIQMTGIVYDSADKEVWRSSRLYYSDMYESYMERNAAEMLSSQIIKLLVAEMRNTF